MIGLLLLPLMAACGGSTPKSGGSPKSGSSADFAAGLAFARCVRANGVPKYPDPAGNGQEPPDAKQIARSDPQFLTASEKCRHLVTNGRRSPTPALADQRDAIKFAGCMRGRGVPNWPEPTRDSQGQPIFNTRAAGIDAHSPQVMTAARSCQALLHLARLPSVAD